MPVNARVHIIEKTKTQTEVLEALKDLITIQCSDGNWNHDPYMHGMANGLILAKSLFTGECEEFLDAPKKWLCDKEPELSICKGDDDKTYILGRIYDDSRQQE